MATPARKFSAAAASLAAKQALRFGPGPADSALPWDVVAEKLAELLRFLAAAVQAVAGELRERAASLLATLASLARAALAVALPAAAVVAALLVVCGCCCVAAGCGRRRGPDGEEVVQLDGQGLGGDGPVVSYRAGYKGGIFSMHPRKPFVC